MASLKSGHISLLPNAGENALEGFECHWSFCLEDFCRNSIHPRGFTMESLTNGFPDLIQSCREVKTVHSGFVEYLVQDSSVHSGGSVEEVAEIFSPFLWCFFLLQQVFSICCQEWHGAWHGWPIDCIDCTEEHLGVLGVHIMLVILCFSSPPLILHSALYSLYLFLEVLKLITFRGRGYVILLCEESLLLIFWEICDTLLILCQTSPGYQSKCGLWGVEGKAELDHHYLMSVGRSGSWCLRVVLIASPTSWILPCYLPCLSRRRGNLPLAWQWNLLQLA